METIGKQEIWSFRGGEARPRVFDCTQIRHNDAAHVNSFMDLVKRVAELQFLNRDFVLLFRGQAADYKTSQGNSSLKPPLFRLNTRAGDYSYKLSRRFDHLQRAERYLAERYRGREIEQDRIKRQRILRWSILQHYEVCPTPLLDVTHSLRIAASFASVDADHEAFIFVLGVPNLSGAITASAEAGLQIVRLSSVCPPAAVRPHIQEGYLLGEYPDMFTYDQKQNYDAFEIDFGRRLVAKFRFEPNGFWMDRSFPQIPRRALYPDDEDPLFELTRSIREDLGDIS